MRDRLTQVETMLARGIGYHATVRALSTEWHVTESTARAWVIRVRDLWAATRDETAIEQRRDECRAMIDAGVSLAHAAGAPAAIAALVRARMMLDGCAAPEQVHVSGRLDVGLVGVVRFASMAQMEAVASGDLSVLEGSVAAPPLSHHSLHVAALPSGTEEE